MAAKQSLLCLFGGKSTEYKVSLMSASHVIPALDPQKYDVHLVGITENGKWYAYFGSLDAIADDTWHTHPQWLRRAVLSASFGDKTLYVESDTKNAFTPIAIDVAVPVLHGANGEDGTVQGLLSLSGIPYVGPHCTASAVAMDKMFTRLILSHYDIPQVKTAYLFRSQIENDPETALDTAERVDVYPLFVKPANAGSSIGVSKASNREELRIALRTAASFDTKVLVEECIFGKEIECAVLGNENPIPSVPGEINPGSDFYDYDTKYITDTSEGFIPARIPKETAEQVQMYAKKIFEVLGCKGLSRVDFFVEDGSGRIIFNEINTLPGFTQISMYPKLWNYMGKPAQLLLDELIAYAYKANADV